MNDVLKTIQDRFSCRGYTDEPVSKDMVSAIAKSGLHAPSSTNLQHWELVVINNQSFVKELSDAALDVLKNDSDPSAYERIKSRGGITYYNAPCMILVLKPPYAHPNADLDCGILVQNLALSATSLGLGCVIAAMSGMPFSDQCPKSNEFKKRVGWKEGYTFGIGILLGHGKHVKEPHEIDLSKISYV